jgi:hypothetical protein
LDFALVEANSIGNFDHAGEYINKKSKSNG